MTEIKNWEELLNKLQEHTNTPIFAKLLLKINQWIKPYYKSDKSFDLKSVEKNHIDNFNGFRTIYEQLLIEKDAIDIFSEIASLSTTQFVVFGIVATGKWIKFHTGNASRIFFYDEEKTVLSDKALADFLNKISDIHQKYLFFGKEPIVYYKFKIMPSQDVIDYLKKFKVTAIEYDKPTPPYEIPAINNNKILMDQSMILTLCSNLSFGLSKSFFRTPEDKTSEFMMENKKSLDHYLEDKILLVNRFVYEQTLAKINKLAGDNEKKRFFELIQKITIVDDEQNPRFYFLKDMELQCVSTAEKNLAIIITSNQRLCNKIDSYYPEIKYKLFTGAQLVEAKFV